MARIPFAGQFAVLQLASQRKRCMAGLDRDIPCVEEALAEQRPIGKQIQLVDGNAAGAIIGIVGDSKQRSLTEAQSAQMYAHYGHMPGIFATIVVRTTVKSMNLSQAM